MKEVGQDTFKEGCQLNERASVSTSVDEAVVAALPLHSLSSLPLLPPLVHIRSVSDLIGKAILFVGPFLLVEVLYLL